MTQGRKSQESDLRAKFDREILVNVHGMSSVFRQNKLFRKAALMRKPIVEGIGTLAMKCWGFSCLQFSCKEISLVL